MKNELRNYQKISRLTWQNLHRNTNAPLSQEELNSIKSLNDKIDLQEVIDIYLPLVNLISIYKKASEDLAFSKSIFLQEKNQAIPFIIGVAGSVAVGKSTTSRLLQLLLSRHLKEASVELVTTDGFLYPNAILEERGILNKKGFPESYDMERLLDFLTSIKNGRGTAIPVYSHEIYDIIKGQHQVVAPADFVIVEGINVFQNPENQHLYISDFFDLALYVDAEVKDIETWYLERFKSLLTLAEKDPSNYYHRFTKLPIDEVLTLAHHTWTNINLANLEKYIKPTRNRADIILHKGENHAIDKIYIKK